MTNLVSQLPVAVIGSGKIGKAVAQLLLRAGYSVCFGSRSPENISSVIEAMGAKVTAKSVDEAVSEAEIIILAVPYQAIDAFIPSLSSYAAGKIVIDATNPFAFSPEKRIISSLGTGLTAGSRMTSLLPASTIVRAFNHIANELLISRGTTQPGVWSMAIAGDAPEAKKIVGQLVSHAGFTPVDIGNLADSSPLDPGGRLFPHLFTEADLRAVLQ